MRDYLSSTGYLRRTGPVLLEFLNPCYQRKYLLQPIGREHCVLPFLKHRASDATFLMI